MRKIVWLLIFLVIGVIAYLVVSRLNPNVDPWIGTNVLTPIANGFTGAYITITTSPFWIAWVTPNLFWIGLGIGSVGMFLFYRWIIKQKRPTMPWKKQPAPEYVPMTQPQPQPTYQPTVTQPPPQAPPQSPPVEPPKEETKAVA